MKCSFFFRDFNPQEFLVLLRVFYDVFVYFQYFISTISPSLKCHYRECCGEMVACLGASCGRFY